MYTNSDKILLQQSLQTHEDDVKEVSPLATEEA